MTQVDLLFRHASFRPGQQSLVTDLWHAVKEGKHVLFNAPTGAGKTDSAISTALTYALQNDLDVFFLTPKTSQHKVAIEVAAGIAKKFDLAFTAVDFVGKKNMCLNQRVKESGDFYHTCERRCKARKCVFKNNSRDKSFAVTRIMTHDELLSECEASNVCAYDEAARVATSARLIVADYYQLFAPPISTAFLRKTGKDVSKSIIIVDEAHNLPKRMRDYLGGSADEESLRKAMHESKAIEPALSNELRGIRDRFVQFQAVKLGSSDEWWSEDGKQNGERMAENKENVVEKNEFSELLGGAPQALSLVERLQKCGEEYVAKEEKQRSACLRLASFINRWLESGSEYSRVISANGLELKCLDSTSITGTADGARSCIAMSGTLLPLEMYRDLIGLEPTRTVLKEYDSYFPVENRLNVLVDSVTTKYEHRTEEGFAKIAAILQQIHDTVEGKELALFFPSYSVMNSILSSMHVPRIVVQREGMNATETSDMLKKFKTERGTLCAVMGGSLSEGIDYSEKEIKCACIVGIPLQEMSLEVRSLVDYYDKKYGKGWEYGYTCPAMNKALQAAGRGIRSEKDKCIVIFLDGRYAWRNYSQCLPQDWNFTASDKPWKVVKAFLDDYNYY